MNWGHLLFSPNGRLSKRHYWFGILIIFFGNILAGLLPIIGGLMSLALIWVGVAVYGKRLHDVGKSAWLHAVPWGLSLLLTIIGIALFGATLLDLGLSGRLEDPQAEEIISILTASGGLLLMLTISTLVWVGYTLWLGFKAPEPGDNAYGPSLVAEQAPAAPAASVGAAPEAE